MKLDKIKCFGLRLNVYLMFECYFNVCVFILICLNLSVYLLTFLGVKHLIEQHGNAQPFLLKTF